MTVQYTFHIFKYFFLFSQKILQSLDFLKYFLATTVYASKSVKFDSHLCGNIIEKWGILVLNWKL